MKPSTVAGILILFASLSPAYRVRADVAGIRPYTSADRPAEGAASAVAAPGLIDAWNDTQPYAPVGSYGALCFGFAYTPSQDYVLQRVEFYAGDLAGLVTVSVHPDVGTGHPTGPVLGTVSYMESSTLGWQGADLVPSVPLVAGTTYYIRYVPVNGAPASTASIGTFIAHSWADNCVLWFGPATVFNWMARFYGDATTNLPPDCSGAVALESQLWPPNHKYHAISVLGVSDPDGDPVTITVTGITQDEPLNTRGDGNTCPDGQIVNGQASVRAERSGTTGIPGNGRVYAISFTASDGQGGECTGTVAVCVPHDQGQASACIDDGQIYESTGPCNGGAQLSQEITGVGLTVGQVTGAQAMVEFSLPQATQVEVIVFDVAGRRLATVADGAMEAGAYQRAWDMSGATKGLYFVRLRAGAVTLTKRMVKVR